MFSVQFRRPGGIEVLEIRDVPVPSLNSGDLLVRFEASSINPADVKIRSGAVVPRVGRPPFTLGYDLVGRIVGAGRGAEHIPIGTRVLGMSAMALTGRGTWAELVRIPATSVARAPSGFEPAELAQLPLAGLTALQAVEALRLPKASVVAVIGAVGAVGKIALQLLHIAGYRAYAVIRSPDQLARVSGDFEPVVYQEIVKRPEFDGVIDTAGIADHSMLKRSGHLVSIVPEAYPSRQVRAEMLQRGVRATLVITKESGTQLERLSSFIRDERLSLPTPTVFPITEIAAAHREFDRKSGSRIVVADDGAVVPHTN